jgi:protein-S-isoprenylcysteine O-methyltransferase Ste14
MSQISRIFLLVIAPLLALLLAWLGVETLPVNPLGWFLLLIGVVYVAGMLIVFGVRRQRFWESSLAGTPTHEERGDRSFWFFSLGMGAAFFLSPLEYKYLPASLPRSVWMAYAGVVLVTLGIALFVWARRLLGKNYSGHVSMKTGQPLVQSGPYRLIRHPAYAGFLLMALGLSLGYSSLAGLVSILVLLLPGLFYRTNIEEQLLLEHFGEPYRQYIHRTKRLIPGIW